MNEIFWGFFITIWSSKSSFFAILRLFFMRKITSLRIVNYNKRNDKQNKKLFLRNIALGFIAQKCAIFIANCFTQHAQNKIIA